MGIRFTETQARNEWLAELLIRQHSLITRYWIEAIRAEDIPGYHAITDQRLEDELPPTVDSMIHAFQTGDIEGPRQHSIGVIQRRLSEGIRLPDLQMSLHALETAVMRIVIAADVGPIREFEALQSASNMYYQVALIAAEVYEQLRTEQQRRFASVYEFGTALSRTLDLDAVLTMAVNEVAAFIHSGATAILLARPNGRRDEARAHHGLDTDLIRAVPDICRLIGCAEELTDGRSTRDMTCIVPDVRVCKRLSRWAGLLTSHGYLSLVCVPLLAKQKRLGSLLILRPRVHGTSESELDFLFAMAGHIANAVQNATLYEEAQGKRELGILLKANKLFTSSLDTQDILSKIARMATEAVRADLAMVFMPSGVQKHVHHVAYYASGKKARAALQRVMEVIAPEDVETGYGGFLRDLTGGKPILLGDYSESPGRVQPLVGVIKSVLAVPLWQKGRLLGALALISMDKNAFTRNDLSMATALGDLAAVAIDNARLYEYERNIAETLQRSFLPSELPSIQGYDTAAFYRPAVAEAEVGGDFYDLFPVSDGDISIVIGDVSGKGLNAAVQTAMGKYMVRAYAAEDPSPASVLGRFNRVFCEYAPEGVFLTAFLGVLDPKDNVLTYASAGHNPPLLYSSSSGRVEQISVTGIALGIEDLVEYTKRRIQLLPGDVLLLYTDGATDVKEDGRRLDIEGLQQLFSATVHAPAEQIVRNVFDGICDFARERLTDDVALVVVKRLETHPEDITA